ncbi:MAG: ABC transporter transmembrane domain-containing protein [Peptoniphilaceae bacterium]|nr:ABC transporter transmembrane domain-containing protein [Peptoniphilaceae bacterium]
MKKSKEPFIQNKTTLQIILICQNLSIQALVLLAPILVQRLLDAAVAKDMPSVNRYAVYSILLGMLHIGVQSLYSYHLEMGDVEMIQGRRALLVRKLAHMNYGSFADHSAGYFLQRFLKDCDMARYLYYER